MGSGREKSISIFEAIDPITAWKPTKVDWCSGDESDPRLDECGITLLTFSLMYARRSPREIALATYRDYYHGGGYDTDCLS
jgi:hypothetical protein